MRVITAFGEVTPPDVIASSALKRAIRKHGRYDVETVMKYRETLIYRWCRALAYMRWKTA